MKDDYIVEEVRRTREKLAEESGFDLHKAAEVIRAHQKDSGFVVVTKNEMDTATGATAKKRPA
jgi:hypothetical protein